MNKDTLIAYASTTEPYRFLLGRVVEEPHVPDTYLPIQRVRTVPRDETIHALYKDAYHILRLKPQKTTNWIDEGALVIVMTNGYWRIGQVDPEHAGGVGYVVVHFANHKTNVVRIKDVFEVDETQLPDPYAKLFPQGGFDE